MSPRGEAVRAAANMVFSENVDGWVCARIPDMVRFCDGIHEQHGITGDIAEIGIHHGKLFFILAAAARDGEKSIAIDLFSNQSLNIDSSGRGDLGQFAGYMERLFPHLQDTTHVIQGDSMSIPPSRAHSLLQTEGIRLFSVDGGHTVHHVLNDMAIAQELLVAGGVVLLDDFMGPHWPGVTEGFFQYMRTQNRRLAPFMFFENKLFLTTFSEQSRMVADVRTFVETEYGDEIHRRWRYVDIAGFQVLSCAGGG